jgi:hypothetical protein
MFRQVLKDLHEIKKKNLQQDSKEVVNFIEKIKNKLSPEQLSLVKQCIKKLYSSSEDKVPESKMAKYKSHFNPVVYQELLNFTELAYSFEQNGNPIDHAEKLAVLFGNTHDALDYILKYAEKNPVAQVMHDACLFDLPTVSNHTSKWLAFARNKSQELLFNSEFKRMLSITADLDAQIVFDMKNKDELIKKMIQLHLLENKDQKEISLRAKIKLAKESINKQLIPLNKLCHDYETGSIKRAAIGEEKYIAALKKRKILYAERACLYLNDPFKQYNFEMLRDAYARYSLTQDSIKSYFTDHGISDANYKKFLSLDRTQAGTNIPEALIDGEEIGYPGFYLRKLNVQEIEDAKIAACLGKLTNCCQSVSGENGEPCAIHGLTNPNGGFYVLFKGNAKNPQPNDPIYAQTWAWRSKNDALVFDSIEAPRAQKQSNADRKLIRLFYRRLADQLTQSQLVPHINCGIPSGVSFEVAIHQNYGFNVEEPLNDYKGYRDSKSQRYLADRDILISSLNYLDEKAFAIELRNHKFLHTNNKISQTIGFAIVNKLDYCLIRMKQIAEQNNCFNEFETYLNVQKKLKQLFIQYAESKEIGTPISAEIISLLETSLVNVKLIEPVDFISLVKKRDLKFIKNLIKYGIDISLMTFDDDRYAPLIHAVNNNDLEMTRLLLSYKININARDIAGCTPLILAVKNSNLLITTLLLKYALNINECSCGAGSALSYALQNNNLIIANMLLDLGANIYIKNNHDHSPLVIAATKDKGEMMKLLIEKCPTYDFKWILERNFLSPAVSYLVSMATSPVYNNPISRQIAGNIEKSPGLKMSPGIKLMMSDVYNYYNHWRFKIATQNDSNQNLELINRFIESIKKYLAKSNLPEKEKPLILEHIMQCYYPELKRHLKMPDYDDVKSEPAKEKVLVFKDELEKKEDHEVKMMPITKEHFILTSGINTFLNKGKEVKTLALPKRLRDEFYKTHPLAIDLLKQCLLNPLVEEGSYKGKRDHEGELFFTYEFLALLVYHKIIMNPNKAYDKQNILVIDEEKSQLGLKDTLQKLALDKDGDNAKILYISEIHARSLYLRNVKGQVMCFILDPEPDGDTEIASIVADALPTARIIMNTTHLQVDYFSCGTFAIKALMYFAKQGDHFFDLIDKPKFLTKRAKNMYDLSEEHLPAPLWKLSQKSKPEKQMAEQMVSQKRQLTLKSYHEVESVTFFKRPYNVSAIQKKYKYITQLERFLRDQAPKLSHNVLLEGPIKAIIDDLCQPKMSEDRKKEIPEGDKLQPAQPEKYPMFLGEQSVCVKKPEEERLVLVQSARPSLGNKRGCVIS